jgi:hypothetical protein
MYAWTAVCSKSGLTGLPFFWHHSNSIPLLPPTICHRLSRSPPPRHLSLRHPPVTFTDLFTPQSGITNSVVKVQGLT